VSKIVAGALLALALVGACAQDRVPLQEAAPKAEGSAQEPAEADRAVGSRPTRVDPKKGGVEITLGEWAITPEAPAIRPGKVTFVIHNRGTMGHGFEIELEGESSGHGSGDLFKAESELLQPGESTRMTMTLGPGAYKIECLVDGHDDMGMEGILEIRRDAPLVKVKEQAEPGVVAISDFAFAPAVAHVAAGTEVTWVNHDPTSHTVTGEAFGSDTLDGGATFAHVFDDPGSYAYKCMIHPDMEGKVEVE
jgi:plastocyanin